MKSAGATIPNIELSKMKTRLKCLGVAYWHDTNAPDDAACAHRIISGTHDRRIIAVDARTGQLHAMDFGVNGAGRCQSADRRNRSGPRRPGRHDLLGAAGHRQRRDRDRQYQQHEESVCECAPSGAIRAFDARTGKHVWAFDPIPRNENDPEAAKNWEPESLAITGAQMPGACYRSTRSVTSYLSRRLRVRRQTSTAARGPAITVTPIRSSRCAARPAQVAWHFQTIHHDVWDWDHPAAPILVDITRDGETDSGRRAS